MRSCVRNIHHLHKELTVHHRHKATHSTHKVTHSLTHQITMLTSMETPEVPAPRPLVAMVSLHTMKL